ncbi:MAG: hypothetical protein ACYDBY_12530 [Thermoanaerobaculia bacterium]
MEHLGLIRGRAADRGEFPRRPLKRNPASEPAHREVEALVDPAGHPVGAAQYPREVSETAMPIRIVEDEDGARRALEPLVSDQGLEAKGVATLADAFEVLGS